MVGQQMTRIESIIDGKASVPNIQCDEVSELK